MKRLVYIVICIINSNDYPWPFYINSIWTSKKKAQKRCDELNSKENEDWREDCDYGLFSVELFPLSK